MRRRLDVQCRTQQLGASRLESARRTGGGHRAVLDALPRRGVHLAARRVSQGHGPRARSGTQPDRRGSPLLARRRRRVPDRTLGPRAENFLEPPARRGSWLARGWIDALGLHRERLKQSSCRPCCTRDVRWRSVLAAGPASGVRAAAGAETTRRTTRCAMRAACASSISRQCAAWFAPRAAPRPGLCQACGVGRVRAAAFS
jgi:hypothetical protein